MKAHPIIWIGTAVLGAAVFWAILPFGRDQLAAAPQAERAAEPDMFAFVRSMEGTKPDGDIKLANDETLMIDQELRRLFDYYLTAIGEKSLDAIRTETERELERRLRPAAASQAKLLLARYLDYKRALFEVEKGQPPAATAAAAARARLTAMQQARTRFFSIQESEGLFGLDDAYDRDAVERLEIDQDKTLTQAQKREKLAALDAALSPALREAREAPLRPLRLAQAAEKMRAEGAGEDEIYRMRAAALNPEAAARLAALDQEQAAWKTRIAAYLTERKKLLEGTDPALANRQATLQQLRDARFDADEQRRLAAYE